MAEDVRSHAVELERIAECDFWSKVKTELILSLVEGQTVLDVGCGAGELDKALLERGFDVTVVDNDAQAVEIARRKGLVGFVADISRWRTDARFDCVIAADVLEHIEDDLLVLKRIYDMLKLGGCVVVNVPSYKFLFGPHDVALGHKRRYSDGELRAKLEAAGFRVEAQRHWNLLALPMTVLITKVLRRDYPHERVSRLGVLSGFIEKLLLLESRVNRWFGISILCKARKV